MLCKSAFQTWRRENSRVITVLVWVDVWCFKLSFVAIPASIDQNGSIFLRVVFFSRHPGFSGPRFENLNSRGRHSENSSHGMTSTLTAYLAPNTCLSTPRLRSRVPKINTHQLSSFAELRCHKKTLATASLPEYVATHSPKTDCLAPFRTRQSYAATAI